MTQRNSPERAQMLFQRRWEQLQRIGGGNIAWSARRGTYVKHSTRTKLEKKND